MSVDFRSYIVNSDRPLIDAKPAAWGVNIDSTVGGDGTTGGTGGLFWQLKHSGTVVSTLTKAGILQIGKVPTASIPAASAGNEGSIVYDSTLKKLKFSTGIAWETVTSA